MGEKISLSPIFGGQGWPCFDKAENKMGEASLVVEY